ncbi:MAG: RNA polymerase sigma factor [bacterium]|nr:RNA polymerase sigma factor [bacterium]
MSNEKWLISRAKTDKNAFLELYREYYPKLYAFLLVQTRNKELAEDIVQETFTKAIVALKNFQYKGRSFGAWLFRIAQNEMISQWRKERKVTQQSPEEMEAVAPVGFSPEEQFINQEMSLETKQQVKNLSKALDELSKEESQLIIMKYVSDLSYKDIAVFLKKRPTTLAVELHRALKKLKDILEKYDGKTSV